MNMLRERSSGIRLVLLWFGFATIVVLAGAPLGVTSALRGEAHAQEGQEDGDNALRLAFQAQAELHSYQAEGIVRSVLLAIESLRRAPTAEAGETLQAGLALLPRRVFQWSDGFRHELISSDDRWAVLRLDARRELWELPGLGNTLTKPRRIAGLPLDGDTLGMGFGPGGKWLLTWTADRLQIWQTDSGRLIGTWSPDPIPISQVEFSTDKQRLFLVGTAGIQVVDASRMPQVRELASIPAEGADRGYAISSNGQRVAAVSADGMHVELWQAGTGELERLIAVPQELSRLLFNPSATHLVTSDERAVHVWDVESGAKIATVETADDYPGIAISSTGEWLITPGAGTWGVDLFAFPPQSSQLTYAESVLRTWNGDSPGLALEFSPNGRWLRRYEGCTQKRCSPWRDVTVWDMESSNPDDRELNLTLAGRIDGASFSPDSRWLHTVRAADGYISQIWSLPEGEEVLRMPGYWTQLSPAGRWLLGYRGNDGPLELWAADPGRQWSSMRHGSSYFGHGAGALAFSPDGLWLATGGVDNVVRVWDVASAEQNLALEHDSIYYLDLQSGIRNLAFSPGGQMLASLNDGGDLRLWDLSVLGDRTMTDTEPLARFKTPPWSSVTFSPDGQWLVADYGAWHIATREAKYGSELYGGYALSPDGQVIAWRKDDLITLVDFDTGKTIHQFEHEGGLGNLVFGPDGRWLSSVGLDTVATWHTATGQPLHQIGLAGHLQGYAISPDRRWIAIGDSGGPPVVWDVESGKAVSHLEPTAVAAVPWAFDPDGQSLLVRDAQGRIRVFDVATGAEMASLPRKVQFSRAVFSPDGKRLATTDTQGNVRFWFWRPDDLIAEACQHVTRNLTAQEWQQYFGDKPYRRTCDHLPALDDGSE